MNNCLVLYGSCVSTKLYYLHPFYNYRDQQTDIQTSRHPEYINCDDAINAILEIKYTFTGYNSVLFYCLELK